MHKISQVLLFHERGVSQRTIVKEVSQIREYVTTGLFTKMKIQHLIN